LRRNNEDKRKAVMTILDDVEWAEWSDVLIAKNCQVSGAFVGRVRKTLKLESTSRKYINQHGKVVSLDTTNYGRPAKEEPEVMPLDEEDHHVQELSDANVELAEENTLLKDRLAVAAFEATPEEKVQLSETMEQLRATIKTQEAEIAALKSSRDTLQQKNADMLKLLAYWKKRAEQAA
jgi:predicted RNase H-like nuclease (RuvC/YqgF family)